MQSIARQMQRTVSTLLSLARCESGLERPEPGEVSVAQLLAETRETLEAAAAARRLRLEIDASAQTLVADREKLAIILGNLLSNAVTYSPEGSTVTATARVEEGALEVTVANSAPHLTAEDLPHLFERFWRQDAARSNGQHTGLGLFLARSLATLLGLELTAALGPDQRLEIRLAGKKPPAKESP